MNSCNMDYTESISDQECEEDSIAEEYDFENFTNEDQMDYLARHFPFIAAHVMANDPEASEDALLLASSASSSDGSYAVGHSRTCSTHLLTLPSINLEGCLIGADHTADESIIQDGFHPHNSEQEIVLSQEGANHQDESEALLDALLRRKVINTVLTDDINNFDINSEELQQFIKDFHAVSKSRCDEHKVKKKFRQRLNNGSGNKKIVSHSDGDGSSNSKVKFSKAKQFKMLLASALKSSKSFPLTLESQINKDVKQESREFLHQALNGEELMKGRDAKKTCNVFKDLELENHETKPLSQRTDKQSEEMKMNGATINESNEQKLMKAAMHGELETMKCLLNVNPTLCNIADLKGNTLLHVSAKFGHLHCLQYLLERVCADLLQRENNDCLTPTALSVKYGQQSCLEWLVNGTTAMTELEVQDNRWSMLHIASRYGQEPCLRWLLHHMQDQDLPLDVLDNKGNTPAHLAAKYGHLYCLQTLVEFNQDITLLNKKQQSPYCLALKHQFNLCTQFLVVVEACSSLSDQVVRLQRELRETRQENFVLKSRLEDAVACTDGLIQMQKTDLIKQVDEIRAEYKSLTSVLIKKLDAMHLQQFDKSSVNLSAQAKQKADTLSDICDHLVNEGSIRESPEGNELQKIENTINRIQQPFQSPESSHQHPQPMNLLRAKLKEVSLQIMKVQSAKTDADKKAWGLMQTSKDSDCLSNSQTSGSSSSLVCCPVDQVSTSKLQNSHEDSCDHSLPNHIMCNAASQISLVNNVTKSNNAADIFYNVSSAKIESKTAAIVNFTGKSLHSPQSSVSTVSSLCFEPKVSKSYMRGERLRTYFDSKPIHVTEVQALKDEHCGISVDSDHDSISHELIATKINNSNTSFGDDRFNSKIHNINASHSETSDVEDSISSSMSESSVLKEIYKTTRPTPIVEKIENSTENLHRIFARHLPANKYKMLKQMPDCLRKVQGTKRNDRKLIKIDVDGVMILSPVVEEILTKSTPDSNIIRTNQSDRLMLDNGKTSGKTLGNFTKSGILAPSKRNAKDRKKSKERRIKFAIDEETSDLEVLDTIPKGADYIEHRGLQGTLDINQINDEHVTSCRKLGSINNTTCGFPAPKIRSNGHLPEDFLKIPTGLSDAIVKFGSINLTTSDDDMDKTSSKPWYDSSDEDMDRVTTCTKLDKHESYL